MARSSLPANESPESIEVRVRRFLMHRPNDVVELEVNSEEIYTNMRDNLKKLNYNVSGIRTFTFRNDKADYDKKYVLHIWRKE